MTTHAEYMKNWRANRRNFYIASLGSICVKCGTSSNLEFDHIDPKFKLDEVSTWSKNKKWLDEEVAKCQLLCHDCHLEKTIENCPEHGTGPYRAGCRCEECKLARRLYLREYRKNKRGGLTH